MMRQTGYLRSIQGQWGPIFGWVPEDFVKGLSVSNGIYVQKDSETGVRFETYVNGGYYYQYFKGQAEYGKLYRVEVVWNRDIGEGYAIVFGEKSPTFPAPTVELVPATPFYTPEFEYYESWLDIPGNREKVIAGGIAGFTILGIALVAKRRRSTNST